MKLWNADDGTYVNIVLITLENEMIREKITLAVLNTTKNARMKDAKFKIIETR